MPITLGDLLWTDVLPDIEILSAPMGFESIPIALTSTQSIYELPVENFIKKNSSLLTFAEIYGRLESVGETFTLLSRSCPKRPPFTPAIFTPAHPKGMIA